jgi:NAD(P)-dependent dehydrogenase (short-subunit alcohol dehydrogenase family)
VDALHRFGLAGRVAIVTGGARGIGRAIAELAAATGAEVALIDMLGPLAHETATEIAHKTGRRVQAFVADLSDPKQAADVTETVTNAFGRVNVLFNCIGINPNTDVLEISPEEWTNVITVNVNAQFFIAQAVARHMAANNGGSIVAIGSNSGCIVDRPQPQAHYNTSKAAVHQMVKSLAVELAPKNIRVNAVAPGYVLTELTKKGVSNPEWLPIWINSTPIGRLGTPEEIANVMLFLASDASSYMTGSVVLVDGGYCCW